MGQHEPWSLTAWLPIPAALFSCVTLGKPGCLRRPQCPHHPQWDYRQWNHVLWKNKWHNAHKVRAHCTTSVPDLLPLIGPDTTGLGGVWPPWRLNQDALRQGLTDLSFSLQGGWKRIVLVIVPKWDGRKGYRSILREKLPDSQLSISIVLFLFIQSVLGTRVPFSFWFPFSLLCNGKVRLAPL